MGHEDGVDRMPCPAAARRRSVLTGKLRCFERLGKLCGREASSGLQALGTIGLATGFAKPSWQSLSMPQGIDLESGFPATGFKLGCSSMTDNASARASQSSMPPFSSPLSSQSSSFLLFSIADTSRGRSIAA
ncbi:hypothetical protein C4D60_Mb04t12690 [Musa balbisiana]|uniref:Uncharacterized protein n=1 Tax=Musa balbisiana TaxID=52838 RepID=A0A4S8KBJ6_MUSBA|nr:hypothetical protein C4D60_Mb04t12690 [Musa balbisiana]